MTPLQTLLGMDDDEFRSVVTLDLRRRAGEFGPALRTPAVCERWREVLIGISKSIEGQLGAKRAEYRAAQANLRADRLRATGDDLVGLDEQILRLAADYYLARAGSLRFKTAVDEALVLASAIRRTSTISDRPERTG